MKKKDKKDDKLIKCFSAILAGLVAVGAVQLPYLKTRFISNNGTREKIKQEVEELIDSFPAQFRDTITDEQIDKIVDGVYAIENINKNFESNSSLEEIEKQMSKSFGDEVLSDEAILALANILRNEKKYWFMIPKEDKDVQAVKCDMNGNISLENGNKSMVKIPSNKLYAGLEMGENYLIKYDFEENEYALVSKDDVDINIASAYKTKKSIEIKIDSLSKQTIPEGAKIRVIGNQAIVQIEGKEYQINKDQIKEHKDDLEVLEKEPAYAYEAEILEYHIKGNKDTRFLGGASYYNDNTKSIYVTTYSLEEKGFGIDMPKENLIETGTISSKREELESIFGDLEEESYTNFVSNNTTLSASDREILEENKGNKLNIFEDQSHNHTIDFQGVKYEIKLDLLDPSVSPARSGIKIEGPNKIMIHDTDNHGASAEDNVQYFKNRARDRYGNPQDVASHFVIDYTSGDVYECIPPTEKAVAAENLNDDVIHIENTIPEDTVEFTEVEWNSLIDLVARLCVIYDLDPMEDLIRHCETQADRTDPQCMNNVTEENEKKWQNFKEKVKERAQLIRNYQEQTKQIGNNNGYDNTSMQQNASAKEFIKEALSHVGETNNDKRFSKDLGDDQSYIDLYCAIYVNYCARKAGIPIDVIPQFTSCASYYSWYESKKLIKKNNGEYIPKVGDLVFFDKDGNSEYINHIGIVTSVQNGKFTTVEGNTANNEVSDKGVYNIGDNNNNELKPLWFASVDYSKQMDSKDYNLSGTKLTANDINIEGINFSKKQKEVIAICYILLRSEGLDHIHTCGILANIYAECSFNPESIADDGAKGLFQYTYHTRKANYEEYIEKYNNEHGTKGQPIEAQIQFALYGKGEKDKSDTYRRKKFATSYDAADYWCIEWERPLNEEEKGKIRGADATKFEKGIPEIKVQAQTNEEQSR